MSAETSSTATEVQARRAVIISGPGVATLTIGALVLLALIEVERAWSAVQLVPPLTHPWTRDWLTEE